MSDPMQPVEKIFYTMQQIWEGGGACKPCNELCRVRKAAMERRQSADKWLLRMGEAA
tara:strand:+ start:36921 stop:37091 length:171 start_codon:yes stop_codon:yes gene_type:complete